MSTSKEIIEDIEKAISFSGTGPYYRQGPDEVMFAKAHIYSFKRMSPQEVGNVLKELLKYEYGEPFVEYSIQNLDGMPDEWFDELLKFEDGMFSDYY